MGMQDAYSNKLEEESAWQMRWKGAEDAGDPPTGACVVCADVNATSAPLAALTAAAGTATAAAVAPICMLLSGLEGIPALLVVVPW